MGSREQGATGKERGSINRNNNSREGDQDFDHGGQEVTSDHES
jgi:hypothetical protein